MPPRRTTEPPDGPTEPPHGRGEPPRGASEPPQGTTQRPDGMSDRPPSRLIADLQERRERHRERGKIYRGAFTVAGFIVTAAGVVMTGPVPGPGLLVIAIGLAMLALEFAWAERLLERAINRAEMTKQKATEASRRQKVLGTVAAFLVIAAAAAAAVLWDVPFLPV